MRLWELLVALVNGERVRHKKWSSLEWLYVEDGRIKMNRENTQLWSLDRILDCHGEFELYRNKHKWKIAYFKRENISG